MVDAEAGTLAGAAATLETGANNPYSGVQLKYLIIHSLAYPAQTDSKKIYHSPKETTRQLTDYVCQHLITHIYLNLI